jgi:hypothetical protein
MSSSAANTFASRSSARPSPTPTFLGAAEDWRDPALQHLAHPLPHLMRQRETPPAWALARLACVQPDLALRRQEHARDLEVFQLAHVQPQQVLGNRLHRHG